MALTTQILVVCAVLSLSNAQFNFNHHPRHHNAFLNLPNLLSDMFQPTNPMQGLLHLRPINHPGIFHSFGGQDPVDFNGGVFGQGLGGFGTEDSMPVQSAPFEGSDDTSQGPVYNADEQGKDLNVETETSPVESGDSFNKDNKNNEFDKNKPEDTDSSNNDKELEKSDAVEKENDQKAVEPAEIDIAPVPSKNNSEGNSVSKHREQDFIVFPDNVDQAKNKITKESSYYVSPQPQPSNGYVSSPGPQIVYVSVVPSGSSTSQVPYVSSTAQSSQSQPSVSPVQNYPSNTNNVQNPSPQYQTSGNSQIGNVVSNNPPSNPAYTLVTLPNNGNSPVYYTAPTSASNSPQNVNYQPLTTGQQYYMVSMNGQNMLIPVNNVQPVPNQSNGNSQMNLIPINVGNSVPSNSQVNYVPVNGQNISPSTPQGNGQVQYVAVQLAPQNNPQSNNQVGYVPSNQGFVQTPAQNTAQGSVSYVPVNSQPSVQNPPQSNNQVNYVAANPQTVQVGYNSPTNSGQVTYVPLNTQNPQNTAQYNLVPINSENNGQNNLMKLVPATLTSNGNVPLLVFKEKAEVTDKKEKKNKKHKK